MSQEERFGSRDRTYSAWHRRQSTRRFVGIEIAQTLHMIDLDAALYVEYDDASKEPLALIETAMDVGQQFKSAAVTRNLAKRADLSAFVLLYTKAGYANPADQSQSDISQFRVMRIWPNPTGWKVITPDCWAKCLVNIRRQGAARLDELWEKQMICADV